MSHLFLVVLKNTTMLILKAYLQKNTTIKLLKYTSNSKKILLLEHNKSNNTLRFSEKRNNPILNIFYKLNVAVRVANILASSIQPCVL